MINKLFRKNNKKKYSQNNTFRFKNQIIYIQSIRAEQNIEVKASDVAKLVDKNMNYRVLNMKSKRAGKSSEEAKCDMYKQTIPQYKIIKKLIQTNSKTLNVDNINYKNLDNKIKELESKRNYKIDLLELDLYSSYIDEFYILKSYMDKEIN